MNDSEKVLVKYEPYFRNDITRLIAAKEGLSPQAVVDFLSLSGLPQQLVKQVFNTSIKTFRRYLRQNKLLNASTSEKLLRLYALYQRGLIVFGSAEAFTEWLMKPAFGIGNLVPLTILDTATGIKLINEELVRIANGDLA
jgi:putative toxin-antitoxin system antitoxin component (TIGR02293 family)